MAIFMFDPSYEALQRERLGWLILKVVREEDDWHNKFKTNPMATLIDFVTEPVFAGGPKLPAPKIYQAGSPNTCPGKERPIDSSKDKLVPEEDKKDNVDKAKTTTKVVLPQKDDLNLLFNCDATTDIPAGDTRIVELGNYILKRCR